MWKRFGNKRGRRRRRRGRGVEFEPFVMNPRAVLLLFTPLAAHFVVDPSVLLARLSSRLDPLRAAAPLWVARRWRTHPPGSALGVAWVHPRTIPGAAYLVSALEHTDRGVFRGLFFF